MRATPPAAEPNVAPPAATPIKPLVWPAYLVLAGFGAGVIASFFVGGLPLRLLAILAFISAVQGFAIGGARIVATLLGMAAAMALAAPGGRLLETPISSLLGTSGLVNRFASMGVAAVASMFLVGLLALAAARPLRRSSAWRLLDRLSGALFGGLEGALFGLLLMWAALAVEPLLLRALGAAGNPPTFSSRIVQFAESVRETELGQAIDAANPVYGMPILALANLAQRVLSDPQATRRFTHDERIRRVHDHPKVQEALRRLAEPPAVIDAEDGVTQAELLALLRSPRVLKILDETDLVAELTPLVPEIQQALQDAAPPESTAPRAPR